MKTSTSCLISAMLLSVSFVVGMGLHGQWSHTRDAVVVHREQPPTPADFHENEIMDEAQLAAYLHMTTQELQNVIVTDDLLKKNVTIYDTYRFIPYGILGSKKVFLKTHIDKWLDYITRSPVK
ncbi:hypothetical protein [Paenibacillus taiwanensis]|uniref:hypothetical protein n=1 Tax=Paenibacillus taiwanensis TaxID=401638 RepID=UPI00048E0C04|nr:hypothetical protein [Paenibacillus taiwanensis]